MESNQENLTKQTANQVYKAEKQAGKTTLKFKEWIEKQHNTEFLNASGASEYYFTGDNSTSKEVVKTKPEVSFIGIPVKTILVAAAIVTTVIILTQIIKKSQA